jgi:hypothetical protein
MLVEEAPVRVSGSVGRLAGCKRVRRQWVIEGRTEYLSITSAFGLGLLDNFFVILVYNRGLRRDQYISIQKNISRTRHDIDLAECEPASDWSPIMSGSLSSLEGAMKSSSSAVFLRFDGRGLSEHMSQRMF